MIFSKESVEAILAGRKTQTRRLVKEGDYHGYDMREGMYIDWGDNGQVKGNVISTVRSKNKKIKWQVGRDYAVQLGGKPGLWYCTKCKQMLKGGQRIYDGTWIGDAWRIGVYEGCWQCKCRVCNSVSEKRIKPSNLWGTWKPLRITINSIRKERLLDITEKEARKEGFEQTEERIDGTKEIVWLSAKTNFLRAIRKIHGKKFSDVFAGQWNPETWVLDFKVAK